jgi:hypothetical protein
MKTPKHSLRKVVSFLNNEEEDGGFWLPNIQRPFVWTEEQITRLFDSILREYPISTLLVWKTKAEVRCRKFIDNFHDGIKLTDFYVPVNSKKKCLVLDGQQRLQSLFIALKGSYNGRELYFDLLSGDTAPPDDMRYKFGFHLPAKAAFPLVRVKDLVFNSDDVLTATNRVIAKAGQGLTDSEKSKVGRHISIVFKTFRDDDGIAYQELDSIEDPDRYREDDVVEVFIRANSGGTRLGKSDLLFALLSSTWDDANKKMEDLLEELNQHGFAFTRDFVLKTFLTVLDQGARYEVTKFRKPGIRERIESEWDAVSNAIKGVLDFVRGKTFIQTDKAIPSYLVLIPVIYARYHFPESLANAQDLDGLLLRALLAGAFSGTPDQLIDDMVETQLTLKKWNTNEMIGVIRSKGRSLELTENRLWELGYGSDGIHLLFNLWYRDFSYTPAYENNLPQVDHIFPQSKLKAVKMQNPATGKKDLQRYRQLVRDQLANCMLLTKEENGAGGKTDTLPEVWFAGKPKSYLDMHLIPHDPALWKLDRFEDFIVARKGLIKAKFKDLLVTTPKTG